LGSYESLGGIVSEREATTQKRRFGQYLRQVREARRLSLDAVEEMTVGYPGRVTKSHLSRIENGQAEPTFPRMFALSQIYGVPIASLAERFESDLRRSMLPATLAQRSDSELMEEGRNLRVAGRHADALPLYDALLERLGSSASAVPQQTEHAAELKLCRITCLHQLARYASAKEETEQLLSGWQLTDEQRVIALHQFTMACYRLGKLSIATMAVTETERALEALPADHRLRAQFAGLKGNLMLALGRPDEAIGTFKEAYEAFERHGDTYEACRFRLNFAGALSDLGKINEARRHLQKAIQLARNHGFDRHLAHGLSKSGALAFREDEMAAAEAYFLQSNAIARPREYIPAVFHNCYYLWLIARARGDLPSVRANERTLRAYLSRVEESMPEAQAYREHLAGGEK